MLCPRIVAIQSAACEVLSSVDALTALLGNLTVLVASANVTREVDFKAYYTQRRFTGLYMPGVVHAPDALAALFVHLASERGLERAEQPIRLVTTNSNNGWALCLLAAYLMRTHGARGDFGGTG